MPVPASGRNIVDIGEHLSLSGENDLQKVSIAFPSPSPVPPLDPVVPRPIAFVSTQAADGTINVSPFSYFSAVGHDPPMLTFSVCRNGDGSKKDTLANVEANG